MNHERDSGNIVRWPRGFSCTLFIYQEQSRDWSAESAHLGCLFCVPSFGEFPWFHSVGGTHFEDTGTKAREMHRNAACFETR